MKNTVSSISLLFLLSACAGPIPSGTPTAMIRFTSNNPASISTVCSGDRIRGFVGFVKDSYWNETSPVKMFGTRPDKNHEVIERLIPAERQFAIQLIGSALGERRGVINMCQVRFWFVPKTGEQYQADYNYKKDTNGCDIVLYKLSESAGEIKKSPIVPVFFKDEDDGCK